ncbi:MULTISPECIES: hypothetical protein [Serratia]|uniref:hypothetical protein n=1 Tax=Serratia TaxID=613 RepID=UPI00066914AC|nr:MULTISPECIES: hypothetical protein [Serratia]MBJ2093715.1 hypothetical protein [Serratia ureilytica]MBN3986823.1 hypothetical protein [Serratia marcescens]RDL27751.1 hypothetical protein DFO62_10174 [Serratia fonticola]
MKFYIANTTKQRHDFAYRQPETGRLIYNPINAGAQSVVMDGTRAEIDQVIQQHAVYGLIDATKIDQNRVYIGLCYSVDKPVESRIIEKAMRDNDDHLTRAAHERRQASVIATNNALNEQESGYRGELEMSAEQRMNANEDRDETQFVDETLAVSTGKGKKK